MDRINRIYRITPISHIPYPISVFGGFHLGTSPKEYLQHTFEELERINPDVILPMHCTGEAFIAMLREKMPEKVVYSNVGSRFTFGA